MIRDRFDAFVFDLDGTLLDSLVDLADSMNKDWEFDVVLGQRDSVPHKPDPAGVFEIAEKLQLVPSDFL